MYESLKFSIRKAAILIALPITINTASITKSTADEFWTNALIDTFETLGSNTEKIRTKTKSYQTAESWYRHSVADVTIAGGTACVIPVAAYVALPAEFVYLMREIYNSSLGLGFIINGHASKDDFYVILSKWGGEYTLSDEKLDQIYAEALSEALETFGEHAIEHVGEKAIEYLKKHKKAAASGLAAPAAANFLNPAGQQAAAKSTAKAGSKLSAKVASKTAAKLSAKVATKTGAKVGGKLATKAATKAGAKIAGKYAVKGVFGWIPVVSAVACGGINAWIMDGILDASWDYYHQLKRVRIKIEK